MSELAHTERIARLGGEPAPSDAQLVEVRPRVHEWQVLEREGAKRLGRTSRFDNIAQALSTSNGIGNRAESEGHHPDPLTDRGKIVVAWWAHKTGGPRPNGFIVAAKTDESLEGRS